MSKSRSGAPRRVAAGLLAGALTVLGFALAPPASAATDVTSTTLAGATRYGTAGAVAAEAYPDGNDSVIIATGEHFADALAASGLAGSVGAPILLVQKDAVPDETAAAIDELGATTATIVGGTAAVSDQTESDLQDLGLATSRVAGGTRYETAAAVADAMGTFTTAIVASGEVAADALTAGPIAAGEGAPILLTTVNSVPAATSDALAGVTDLIIVGGTARISAATRSDLEDASNDADGATVLAGTNRQKTAVAIADYEVDTLGWGATGVILAAPTAPSTKEDMSPDALVSSSLAGLLQIPILLIADTDNLGPDVLAWITDHADSIVIVYTAGGPAAVNPDVSSAAADAATTEEVTNQTFSVPQEKQVLEQKTLAAGGTLRTCIVSGIPVNSTVDAVLLPSANVTNTAGTLTFADANSNNQADETALVPARIVNVNGTNVTPATRVNDIVAGVGAISVTLYSDTTTFSSFAPAGGDVTLVVHADTFGGDNDLFDLTVPATANALPKTPSEVFGSGCRTVFIPAEHAGGSFGSSQVSDLDKDLNYFVVTNSAGGATLSPGTFYYDDNDTYTINGVPQAAGAAGMAAFEAALSHLDPVSGVYAPDPSGASSFSLTDAFPQGPVIAAAVISPTSVGIDITPSLTAGVDSYNILRCTGSTCTDFVQIGNVLASALGAGNDFVDTGLATGSTYRYEAQAVDDGDTSPASNIVSATPTTASADVAAPTSLGIVTTTNGGLSTTLDATDVFKVVFSEPMSTPDAGDLIRVSDGDATASIADIVNGTNATFALNATAEVVNGVSRAANTVLTVTMTADPTPVTIGTIPGIQYPATVIDQTGNTDLAGNQWNFAGSADKVVNGAFGS